MDSLCTEMWIWGAAGTQGCRRCWGIILPSVSGQGGEKGRAFCHSLANLKIPGNTFHFKLPELCRANPPCREATLSFPKEI